MEELLSIGTTLGLAGIAGIVWLVRLEGRINTEERLRASETEAIANRLNGFEQRIYDALERIESKIDKKQDR